MGKFNFKNIFVLGLVFLGIAAWQIKTMVYAPSALIKTTYVTVNKGSGSSEVGISLKKAGVINNVWLFKLLARSLRIDKTLKAGEYSFEPQISLYDTIQKLANGEVVYRKITIPEGLTSAQIFQLINDEPLLSGEITIEVKEGELLPETYSFVNGDTKDSIILQAKKAMQETIAYAWQNRSDDIPLKNANDLLVLASIIEKETAVDSERKLVASVFINRLKKGMKLQTDPTVIYAITQGKTELTRALTRKDLKIDSPYNTYKYYGLPPSPICNPGKASLEAAANPDVSSYLYFVANGTGGHNFAKSLKEHNTNVSNWKKIKK